jgi:hypothetical protein
MEKIYAQDYPLEILKEFNRSKILFTSYSNKNVYEFD